MFTHYIFDFDGTLFDSYPHTTRAFLNMLSEFGKSAPWEAVNRSLRISFGQAYRDFQLSREEIDRFLVLAHELDTLPEVAPYPGAKEFISDLVAMGKKCHIYTHRENRTLYAYLDRYDMTNLFTLFVTENDGFPLKPAPDALLSMMARGGFSADTACMIGDREIDVLAGKNAGMKGCLFDEDHINPPTTADFTVHNFAELRKLFIEGELI